MQEAHTYLFTFFTDGSQYLIGAATGDTTPDKTNIFSFVDDAFNIFFQSTTWIQIGTLVFDLVGILALFILIYVIISYLLIMAKVLISYLLTVLALSILIAIAPLFIVMILFQRTKKYFDGWINYLADYALQAVILFVSFYIVSTIFVNMWLGYMNFQVCWGGIIEHKLVVNLNIISNATGIPLPNINLGCFQWFRIISGNSFYTILIQSLTLVIFVSVIRGIIGHVSEITSAITGTQASSGIDKVTSSIGNDAKNAIKSAPKVIAKAVVDKALQLYGGGGSGAKAKNSGAAVSQTTKRPGGGGNNI